MISYKYPCSHLISILKPKPFFQVAHSTFCWEHSSVSARTPTLLSAHCSFLLSHYLMLPIFMNATPSNLDRTAERSDQEVETISL